MMDLWVYDRILCRITKIMKKRSPDDTIKLSGGYKAIHNTK